VKIAITGATGTLGRELIKILVNAPEVTRIVALSRDEVKMGDLWDTYGYLPHFRAFLGDVRDAERLRQAFRGIDAVIHAAALKRVAQSSYSPRELVKTNVLGSLNVVDAATEVGVRRVVLVSSDKACMATNLYGATKFVMECCGVQDNSWTAPMGTEVVAVRYGNVFASRGSVVHLWREQIAKGEPLTLTDPNMTRFWLTVNQAALFVLDAARTCPSGAIAVPKLPSFNVVDLLNAMRPEGYRIRVTGLRTGGEKRHETLISPEEGTRTRDWGDRYVIAPSFQTWSGLDPAQWGQSLPSGFSYDSNANTQWLTQEDLCLHLKRM
jgi:UDP-N-acetylglucosamine 4,6-dehydratase